MKKKLIIKLFLLSFASLHAHEDPYITEYVIQRAYDAIEAIEEDKMFLRPESLSYNQGSTYIEDIDGRAFAVPVTLSSEGRPFMQISEDIRNNGWICECKAWNHNWEHPLYCQRCGRRR